MAVDTPAQNHPAPDQPRRKRRRWPWILAGFVALMLLLVLLLPSLLSTGPGERFLLGQINSRIRGTLHADDLSLGWFSGFSAQNLTLKDPDGSLILDAPTLTTNLSAFDLLTQDFSDLSTTLRANALHLAAVDDTTNLQRALEAPPTQQPAGPADPSPAPDAGKLPALNLQWDAQIAQLTWRDPQRNIATQYQNVNATGKLDTTAGPLAFDITAAQPNGANTGGISAKGAIALFANRTLKPLDQITGKAQVRLDKATLGPLAPLLQALEAPLYPTTGILDATLAFDAPTPGSGTLAGTINGQAIRLTGPALAGDILPLQQLTLPVDLSWQGDRISVQKFNLQSPLASLQLQGDTTLAAVRALANATPGQVPQSSLTWTGNADVAAIANALPNLIGLQRNVQLTSGTADLAGKLATTEGKPALDATATLRNVAGTRDGQRITLDPVALSVAAAPANGSLARSATLLMPPAAPGQQGGRTLRATITPAADPGAMGIDAHANLDALTDQLNKFIDMGGRRFVGIADVKGTLTLPQDDGPIALNLPTLRVQGFQTDTPGSAPTPATNITGTLIGTLDVPANAFTATADSFLQEQDPATGASNRLDIQKGSVIAWAPTTANNLTGKLTYDLARLEKLLKPFLPETLAMAGKGTTPLTVKGRIASGTGLRQFRSLSLGTLTLPYDTVAYKGVELGKGALTLAMKDGVIAIPRQQLPANKGTITALASIDLTQDPPLLTVPEPVEVAQGVSLNRTIAAGPLRFLPIVWGQDPNDLNILQVDGSANVVLKSARIPLDYQAFLKSGTADATLSIKGFSSSSPLYEKIAANLGPLLKITQTTLRAPTQDIAGVDISLKDGKIAYDKFPLNLGRLNLAFGGNVGLDENRLNISVLVNHKDLPVPIPLAIGGTVSKPEFKLSDKAITPAIEQAVPNLIEQLLEKNRRKKE